MKYRRALLPILWLALAPAAAHAETWAEKLGYPGDARVLLIHADDIGMIWEANVATETYFESGRVVSGSLMAACPWFNDFVAWARRNPGHDLGLHMTLNSEWRGYRWTSASRSRKARRLLDSDGYLHREQLRTFLAPRRSVKNELRAQGRRARQAGLTLTHIDTHMGSVFLRRGFLKAYLEVSKELGVPAMVMEDIEGTIRCLIDDDAATLGEAPMLAADAGEHGSHGELGLALRFVADQIEQEEGLSIEEIGARQGLTGDLSVLSSRDRWIRIVARLLEKRYGPLIDKHPFPKLDRFCAIPYGATYQETRQNLLDQIEALPPGITQYYLHPTLETEGLRRITGKWPKRVWDARLFADPEVIAFLEDSANHVAFTTWQEMTKRYRSRPAAPGR